MRKYTVADYPLMSRRRDDVFTPNGRKAAGLTFENVDSGLVDSTDFSTGRQSLLAQAEIAESAGSVHIARNFRRAAEMTQIDDARIVEIYNALRPYRSSESELSAIAAELREKYQAEITARFVEEAALILKKRSLLKR
jgi:propanediol dehydratase small subunit